MHCAHCGHELSTRRMLFGGRFMGGWRCSACGETFYADWRDFKPAVGQWRFLSLYLAAILLLVYAVFAGMPIWAGIALFAVVIAILVAANVSLNAQQWREMPTYRTQPRGQREGIQMRLAAMIVFWSGWYVDSLVIQRFEATEPYHAVLTIVCAVVAAGLLFRGWEIQRANPRT